MIQAGLLHVPGRRLDGGGAASVPSHRLWPPAGCAGLFTGSGQQIVALLLFPTGQGKTWHIQGGLKDLRECTHHFLAGEVAGAHCRGTGTLEGRTLGTFCCPSTSAHAWGH